MSLSSIEAGFANVLRRFEFHNHQANRWLLLERARREAIMAEAGLLDILEWEAPPIHVGNIVCGEQRYDWGHVIFDGITPEFTPGAKASVYAGFEFLIRQCGLFPSFICISDLRQCEDQSLDSLPVFGSRIAWDRIPREQAAAFARRMMELHQIVPRKELLIEQPFEVSDAELFARYFQQLSQSATDSEPTKPETAASPSSSDEDGPSLDDLNLWHS